jgi:NAD-dependent deacetylase
VELKEGDLCEQGSQLRPHIVWFGEDVPLMSSAQKVVSVADVLVVVGTSLQVYPAAGLAFCARPGALCILVDPRPAAVGGFRIFGEGASAGLARVTREVLGSGEY